MDRPENTTDKELTSTMGNVLSTSNSDDKTDNNDALPTSSTDAATNAAVSQTVSDDPCSSTSTEQVPEVPTSKPEPALQEKDKEKGSVLDSEAELLGLGITNISTGGGSDNVEDIVQDLENLLGGSSDLFSIKYKASESSSKVDNAIDSSEPGKNTIIEPAEKCEESVPVTKSDSELLDKENEVPDVSSNTEVAGVVCEVSASSGPETIEEPVISDSKIAETKLEEPESSECIEISTEKTESQQEAEVEEKMEVDQVMEVNSEVETVIDSNKNDVCLPQSSTDVSVDQSQEIEVEQEPAEQVVESMEVSESEENEKSSEIEPESQKSSEAIEVSNEVEEKKNNDDLDIVENQPEEAEVESKEVEMKEIETVDEPQIDTIQETDNSTVEEPTEIESDTKITEEPTVEAEELITTPVIEAKVIEPSEDVPQTDPVIETVQEPIVEVEAPEEKINESNASELDENIVEHVETTDEIVEACDNEADVEKVVEPSVIKDEAASKLLETIQEPEHVPETMETPLIEGEAAEVIMDEEAETKPVEALPIEAGEDEAKEEDVETQSMDQKDQVEAESEKASETAAIQEVFENAESDSTLMDVESIITESEVQNEQEFDSVITAIPTQETEAINCESQSPKPQIEHFQASDNPIEEVATFSEPAFEETEIAEQIDKNFTFQQEPEQTSYDLDVAVAVDGLKSEFREAPPQSQENMETLLAVASLQTECASNTQEYRMEEVIEENRNEGVEDNTGHVDTEELERIVCETAQQTIESADVELIKESKLEEPLSIKIDETDKAKPYSPKITIKPIKAPEEDVSSSANEERGSLKMTITKQSDKMHSILKIYNPEEDSDQVEQIVPKLIIKSHNVEQQHSPKMSTRSSKQYLSPTSTRSGSPRITIKPVVKTDKDKEAVSPLKISLKQINDSPKQKHSPKLKDDKPQSPRVTIKPIVRPEEEVSHNPRITIKPIPNPEEEGHVPKLTIKPIKPEEEVVGRSSPKITIKPIKPPEAEVENDEEVKERIVLKINKGNINTPSKEKKREHEEDKSEKLAKITLKFSKGSEHPHIVQPGKRVSEEAEKPVKRLRGEFGEGNPDIKENVVSPQEDCVDLTQQDSLEKDELQEEEAVIIPVATPRRRGRPRKVPLEIRQEFKEPKEDIRDESPAETSSGRPKRSCRGQNVRDTLGIKPRKPRGPGRGRGGYRGIGTRAIPMKPAKEPKLSKAKLKLMEKTLKEARRDNCKFFEAADDDAQELELEQGYKFDGEGAPIFSNLSAPVSNAACAVSNDSSNDVVIFEEETRMSADTNSRAQTPAKQIIMAPIEIEDTQSSMQSNATVDSGMKTPRANKAPRLEVHQEPEGAVISADQLTEYYWGGNGPFMLQEQVAQFLGIKSFKRKYPGMQRRMVDMQERDFIRESGLASEAMCDLGLTAVNSADVLDIMYSDFQDKYEEYCKHQRDRQAKDLINKQKALTLAASQEKTKLDLTEQAVQSAASWNASFNKERKEQRKASMDLQTYTVHYPKGKMKPLSRGKIGHYPVALVPGQFTDFYQEFTPTEINNLPINTMCYDPINMNNQDESEESSESESESESSSSESDSSASSSAGEDCKLCVVSPMKKTAAAK